MIMGNAAKQFPFRPFSVGAGSYVRPAMVLETLADKRFKVRLRLDDHAYSLEVRLAVPLAGPLRPGAEVVVAGEDAHHGFIIGILQHPDPGDADTRQVLSPSGASARAVSTAEGERIQVHDAEHRLIFEYDPVAGKSSLAVPHGDLELLAREGDIRLRAGRQIQIQSDDQLHLTAAHAVTMSAATKTGGRPSRLRIDGSGAVLSGQRLGVSAQEADLHIDATTFHGRQLTAALERAKVVAGKLETVAVRLIERAKESYHFVEKLHEIKAGRMRRLIRGAFHLQSENTSILAKDDVRIDGKRINLG
jgi:hypothetical protein